MTQKAGIAGFSRVRDPWLRFDLDDTSASNKKARTWHYALSILWEIGQEETSRIIQCRKWTFFRAHTGESVGQLVQRPFQLSTTAKKMSRSRKKAKQSSFWCIYNSLVEGNPIIQTQRRIFWKGKKNKSCFLRTSELQEKDGEHYQFKRKKALLIDTDWYSVSSKWK